MIYLTTPLTDADVENLHSGDSVLLSGVIYTARDAAHKRLYELIQQDEPLPIDVVGQVIYYVGPVWDSNGRITSAGPTTSGRMDLYTPALLSRGLKGMIGKGVRNQGVLDAIQVYKAVYFGAVGGAGALLAKRIVKAEVVAYEDLGTEAIHRLEVVDFPLIVINDMYGGDAYSDAATS